MGLAVLLSVWLVLAVGSDGDAAAAQDPAGMTEPMRTYVLEPGETLWDVAVRLFPTTDPRETVLRLQRLNGLDSALVQAGRQLWLPAP